MLICAPIALWAQIDDDFSDGNFTENPAWGGDEVLFVVENEQLRSNSPGAATYAISTPSFIVSDTEWRFYTNLDFATSGVNFVDVFLVSDNDNLILAENGYFLRMGGTPDEISLFKLVDGSAELLIDGEDGMIESTSNNIFGIAVQRDVDGGWQIWIDKNNNGIVQDGGTAVDDSIETTVAFGFRITQSGAASAVNSHYFDDILVGPIPVDETPPELIAVDFSSSTDLTLTFNEFLDVTSAEEPANYSVDGGIGTPQSAGVNDQNPAEVSLSLALDMTSVTLYTITVSGVEDLAGNAMTVQEISFLFFETAPAQFKNIVFNEILPDPSPSVGLPEEEFIELYNPTDNYYALDEYILVNTTTENPIPAHTLHPGAYLLLCHVSDTGLFSPYGDVLGIPSFTALANSGDSLTLINPDGEMIDWVSYTDSWYGSSETTDGGYSLELINPFTECSGPNNWRASADVSGGTPGAVNSIFDDTPDMEPPIISEVNVLSNTRVMLFFNEVMDTASLIAENFSLDGGIEVQEIGVSADLLSAELLLSDELEPGVPYQLVTSGLTDCVGNEILPGTLISIFFGEEPVPGELIISEIMVNPNPPVGLPNAEYFELYNNSDKAIELLGCALENKTFQNSRVILPGAYVLCTDDGVMEEFTAFPNVYSLPELGSTFFTNGGRELQLFNPSGERVDYVNYDLSWYGDSDKQEGGYSLERINLNEPCRGGENWAASESALGGTPGEENSVFSEVTDTVPPVLLNAFVHDSITVELVFNEVLDEISALLAILEFSPEIAVAEINIDSPAGNALELTLESSLAADVIYEIDIREISDCTGNLASETQSILIGRPEPAEPGDVLINEVLFNPRTGGSDFVEIVNASEKIISLRGWKLLNQDFSEVEITENPQVLLPGEYLVLTRDAANIEVEYPFGKPENYLEMEATPAYNNGGGTVIIADALGTTIDLFDYLEEYHLSLLNSVKGVSLERLSFTRPTNEPGNWTSAAEHVGFATPGYLNSQYNPEGSASANFELEENIFSPDNDGFQDIMLINYTLDEPGSIANIKIFDRRGREVKELESGLVLGTSGTISWDGVTDNGSKARIGPHIVFVDVFHPNGFTHTQKLPVIVAGKLSD